MTAKFHIYALLTNDRIPFYVGKTCSLKRRMLEHVQFTEHNKRCMHYPLYRKINKMRREEGYKLKYAVLEYASTLEAANEAETTWIKDFRENGLKLYNLTDGGEGTYGHKPVFTKEWRDKLSRSAHIRALTNNSFKGKHHTDKAKQLISRARMGRFAGDKNPFYGRTHTEETRQTISRKNKGKLKGVPKSALHRMRIGLAHKGRKLLPEHAAKNRDRRGRQDPRVKPIKVTLPDGRAFVCIDGALPLTVFLKTMGVPISQAAMLAIVNGVTKKLKTKCRFEHVERPAGQVEAIVSCTN